jgi:hypothetical protein
MQRIAKISSWFALGIVFTAWVVAALSSLRMHPVLLALEMLIAAMPFGLALLAFVGGMPRWLSKPALYGNVLVLIFSVLVVAGELIWHMFGLIFIPLFLLTITLPGLLNCLALRQLRSRPVAAPAPPPSAGPSVTEWELK